MAQQGGRIDFQVGFKADKSGIQDLKKSLQQIQKIKPANFDGANQDLQEIKSTAKEVEAALSKAFNPNINSINLKTFDNELKASGKTINDIYTSFSKAGAQGQVAFSQMARSVLTTNQQLKETHSIINQMGTTFINTVKWGIASSIMNTFTSSVQGAFTYVESLEKSLTNIRIVTGDSQEKMEQFADSANRAAQELGRSTMDYSKAALTFYQQGLGDEDVQARTEAVLKAQNITGAGSEMADYMTSVWNGYKVANEQAQLYVDKLAAVADSSASDMSQLAIAMSKVASTANTMGVNVDQLNAQIATVVATTRQAPEAVGTAFKTIYTRMNDIKTGSDEAEISLGNYSGKMAELGFNVLDATGHLRDTGQVMQEIGGRWENLTREQQVYLATTMGGQRQVNQLMALFDNWTTYSELLNTSLESEGTLAQKNSVYLESLGAKMEQLGAAGERVKASLIDSESFGSVIELLTAGTNLLGGFIQAIGGGGTALLGLGGIATQVFSGVLTKQISAVVTNMQNLQYNEALYNLELAKTKELAQNKGINSQEIEQLVRRKSEIQQYYSIMSEGDKQAYNDILMRIGQIQTENKLHQQTIALNKQYTDSLQAFTSGTGTTLKQQLDYIKDISQTAQKELDKVKNVSNSKLAESTNDFDKRIQSLIESFDSITGNMETSLNAPLQEVEKAVDDAILHMQLARSEYAEIFDDKGNIKEEFKEQADSLKENYEKAISEVQTKYQEFLNELKKENNLALNIKVEQNAIQKNNEEIGKLNKGLDTIKEKAQQEYNINGIVKFVGALGRAASAISSLQNIGKIIKDESLSNTQKAVKITTALSYGVLGLASAYKEINDILHITEALQTFSTTLHATEVTLLGAETVETGLLTAAKIKLAAAQTAVNAAYLAHPFAVVGLAIAGVIAAISAAIAVYDKFTMSTEQAEQAINNFNKKAEQTRNNVKEYNTNISNLQTARSEWDKLSQRAGYYNSTINNLTEEEKARYYELSDLIAQYNGDAVIGYDEQGHAILQNNKALEDTIALLKEKRQLELDSTYDSKEYKDAQEGKKVTYKSAKEEQSLTKNDIQTTTQDLTDKLQARGRSLSVTFQGLNEETKKEFENEISRLDQIMSLGSEGIFQHREELINLFEKFQQESILPSEYGNIASVGELQDLNQYLDTAKENLKNTEKEISNLQKVNTQEIIERLQTSDYNQLYKQAENIGIENINGIISAFVQGMNTIDENGQLLGTDALAKTVNEKFLSPFMMSLGQIGEGGNTLYQNLINSIINDEELNKAGLTLEEKNNRIQEIVQNFLNENSSQLKSMFDAAKENPEVEKAFQQIFANMFNIENLDIDFNTGKVQDIVNQKIQNITERITEDITQGLSLDEQAALDLPTNEIIASLLPSDITDEELDSITERIETLIDKTGSWRQALALAIEDGTALANLNTNLDTVGLLNKQAAGDKLSDKEVGALKDGLDILKRSYSDLQDEVEILNSEWMQGTSQYESALRKVKGALLETLVQSVAEVEGEEQRLHKQEEVNDSIINMTTSMEDLQQAWFALNLEGQQNALIKVASSYESCKNEIQAYTLALKGNNDEEKAAAANDLVRATYAAEMGQQYGIEAERISELADEYARLASEGQAEYAGLNENAELAADAATRYIRLNDAIADLQKNYDSMTQLLNAFASGSQNLGDIIADNSEAYASLKKDLAGIIDVSEDMIDQDWGDWISDNADLIKQAMEGSQEAVDALQQSAAQKIDDVFNNIDIDGLFSTLDGAYDSVADWANSLPEGKLGVDDLNFVQGLTDALTQAGYTAGQIEDIFSGMNIDVDFADEMVDAGNEMIEAANQAGQQTQKGLMKGAVDIQTTSSTATSQDAAEATQIEPHLNQVSANLSVPVFNPVPSPWGVFYDYAGQEPHPITTYGVSIDTNPVEDVSKKETTGTGLKVIGANKSAGGKVSHKNKSGGNKKSSGGKGGKGKKGKGGKGKKGSTKTPKTQKPVTDKPDRYHDVNLKIKDIDNDLGKLQKKQQKLTGKDLLKNLNEQLKLLEKQVATYKEKIQLEKQEANQIRSRLKKQGATFDPNGNISNYSKLLNDALKEYNEAIAKYNKMSAEEQQKNKDLLENAKLKYENLKKDIQRYDKIISEEIPGLEKSIQEAIDKQTEINIKKFKIKVDLEMDMSEAQREFNEFARKVKKQLRDDDILGNAKSYLKDYSSYYKGGYDVIQGLTDQVFNTLAEINNINKQGISSIYGTDKATALKDLQEYTQALMSNLEDIEDVVANIKDSIFDAIDKAQDAFDEQKKEYEYIADLIEHNQKVVELLYGEDAYKQLQKYYELQEKNNKDQLDFLRQQKEMWYSRMEEERVRMNNLTEGTNAWKEANDRFEEYKRHWMDAVDDINSQIEDSLDNLIDKYTNAVDKIFLVFENNITNGKGLDNIAEEWQLIGKQADQYLDKVNSMYEIDKLENAYKDAIDDNDGNIKAQQSLNNLMNEQLKYLKDKDKLTQYDVDRANALLQIEIKRLALEQARQSKTKLRLRRDAQGNYTYQYTADQDATRQAQQELADAQNSLYNLTKQAYKNNLDDYYDTTEEMNEKIRDVYKDTTLSAEEQNQKIAMIYEYYGDIINNLTQQNEDLKKFMMEDTFNEMAKMYNTNVQNFKNMTDEEKDILMNDMVPYWKSSIQDMADTFAGAGGFGPITQDLFNDLIDNSKDYQNSLDEIGKIAGVSLEDIKNATDVNIQRAETLLEKNDELIDSYNEEMSKVQQVINEVERLVQTYQRAKDAAIQATEAAYEYTQRESANTANQLIDNKNTAGSSQYTKAAAFDTGGYTGDWGDVGKTAILHEKEIVLNAQDTINLLSAVKITRTLSDIISNFNMEPIGLGRVVNNTNNSSNSTSQNITIHADFPNVTEKSEIEAAFNNLVNKASQYAFRK